MSNRQDNEKEYDNMFCPKCKCEYAKGIKICPKCDVSLVKKLPSEKISSEPPVCELVTVFTSTHPGTIALAKSILEGEGIEYYVNNEFMQTVYGIGMGFPAQIIVREPDKEKALLLLSDLE